MLRLELLQQWGGAYLDMDILVLAPLDQLHRQPRAPEAATPCARGCNPMCQGLQPYACRHELSMAHEGVEGTIGLGNALMLARPNASLLRVWYERYRGFSDAVWHGFQP